MIGQVISLLEQFTGYVTILHIENIQFLMLQVSISNLAHLVLHLRVHLYVHACMYICIYVTWQEKPDQLHLY